MAIERIARSLRPRPALAHGAVRSTSRPSALGVHVAAVHKHARPGGNLETLVSIVGGVGLFLLGMAVMTDGLKALAGTALKTVMEKAAATPLLGTFWGAVITLIVQSSSATTMTTIGLVSAGLLDVPARPEPGLRRQHRHHRHGLAGGGVRGPDLAHRRRSADRVRRRAAQGGRARTIGGGGRGHRRLRADPGRPVDASAGHGRPCRIVAPVGPAHDHQRRRRHHARRHGQRAACWSWSAH